MHNLYRMSEVEKEKLFNKYSATCREKAKVVGFKYSIDIEELISESYFIFCTCVDNYNESKGTSFDVYLHGALNKGLERFCEANRDLATVYASKVKNGKITRV